jgi:hypothetical protein
MDYGIGQVCARLFSQTHNKNSLTSVSSSAFASCSLTLVMDARLFLGMLTGF